MTSATAQPARTSEGTTAKDPRTLVTPEVFGRLVGYFAARQEVTTAYAERAVGQFLVFLLAHARRRGDDDFGMLLPNGDRYRVVPTTPVDAVWHAVLQHTEAYEDTCEQIGGEFVHHRPILTEAMQDGTAIAYTLAALHDTGYRIDLEFWDGEAESCCPPNPPQPGDVA